MAKYSFTNASAAPVTIIGRRKIQIDGLAKGQELELSDDDVRRILPLLRRRHSLKVSKVPTEDEIRAAEAKAAEEAEAKAAAEAEAKAARRAAFKARAAKRKAEAQAAVDVAEEDASVREAKAAEASTSEG